MARWVLIARVLVIYALFLIAFAVGIHFEGSSPHFMSYYRGFNGYPYMPNDMKMKWIETWINSTRNNETRHYYNRGVDARYNYIIIQSYEFSRTWNEAQNIAYARSQIVPEDAIGGIYESVVDAAYVIYHFLFIVHAGMVSCNSYLLWGLANIFFIKPVAYLSFLGGRL